jgi:protein-S-isoprenylcysteine O-methyltransferase Ste14
VNSPSLLARTALFVAVFPASVTILGPYLVLSASGNSLPLGALRFVGVVPIAVGVPILLWCFKDFVAKGRGTPAPWDAPRRLVTRGLYRYVRNPMYVGILLVLIGEAFVWRSAFLIAYAAAIWLVFHLFVTVYEEHELSRRFGADYREYRREVRRWIPRPPRPGR